MMSEEEKAIKNIESFADGKDLSCVSAKEMRILLDLYKKEKQKNKDIKEQMEKMNIADAGSLLAEFDRLECIEDEADKIRVAYLAEKEKNKELEEKLDTEKYANRQKSVKIFKLENDYISKDKIKAKIEELELLKKIESSAKYTHIELLQFGINQLQELLE